MRIAILAVLFLSAACSTTPKAWQPSPWTPPPGAPPGVWSRCYNKAYEATGRRFTGPSEAGGYHQMTPDEQACVQIDFMKECMKRAEAEVAASGKIWNPADGTWGDWEEFLEEAESERCGSDRGGTKRAKALARVLRDSAREAGVKAACACN